MATYQDYSTIKSHVDRYAKDLNTDPVSAFYFIALNLILGLQDDEIEDSITDNNYLVHMGDKGGHDRGIDALYIDETDSKTVVHMFNFKYVGTFEKTSRNFPAGEIDKILNFLNSLMLKDCSLQQTVNPILYDKVKEIWNIFEKTIPHFVMHLCANLSKGLEKAEKTRFERGINVAFEFPNQISLNG